MVATTVVMAATAVVKGPKYLFVGYLPNRPEQQFLLWKPYFSLIKKGLRSVSLRHTLHGHKEPIGSNFAATQVAS